MDAQLPNIDVKLPSTNVLEKPKPSPDQVSDTDLNDVVGGLSGPPGPKTPSKPPGSESLA